MTGPTGYVCKCCGAVLERRGKWCSGRCRKAQYGDPCVDCGRRTSYGAEHKRIPDPRCKECAVEHYRTWTREAIVARIQEWAQTFGDTPAVPDWCPLLARHLNDPERAERYIDADGYWPSHSTVFNVFGSWNSAMEAAGFEPRAAHGGSGNELRRRLVRAAA